MSWRQGFPRLPRILAHGGNRGLLWGVVAYVPLLSPSLAWWSQTFGCKLISIDPQICGLHPTPFLKFLHCVFFKINIPPKLCSTRTPQELVSWHGCTQLRLNLKGGHVSAYNKPELLGWKGDLGRGSCTIFIPVPTPLVCSVVRFQKERIRSALRDVLMVASLLWRRACHGSSVRSGPTRSGDTCSRISPCVCIPQI